MRKSITYAAAMLCALGASGGSVAAGNSSSAPYASTPPAIVQTAVNTVKPDMVFDGGCSVMQGTRIEEGMNGFFPAQDVGVYFNNVYKTNLDISKATTVVLKEPSHGALKLLSTEDAGTQGIGVEAGPMYVYHPHPGYLGSDEATLLIEINGKSYRSHVKFYVVEKVNDNNFYGQGTPATLCANNQPKRVATLTFTLETARLGTIKGPSSIKKPANSGWTGPLRLTATPAES